MYRKNKITRDREKSGRRCKRDCKDRVYHVRYERGSKVFDGIVVQTWWRVPWLILQFKTSYPLTWRKPHIRERKQLYGSWRCRSNTTLMGSNNRTSGPPLHPYLGLPIDVLYGNVLTRETMVTSTILGTYLFGPPSRIGGHCSTRVNNVTRHSSLTVGLLVLGIF